LVGTEPASKQPGSIFVSIASYRDPQLVPTVRDCLEKARNPERLRFGICWQHGGDEELPDWFSDHQFSVLEIDYRESRGPCWARAEVMKLWDGEQWYLQLDSHHRFVPDWDLVLLDEAARVDSDRFVLTSYAPPFSLGEAEPSEHIPTSMQFARFSPYGIPLFEPGYIAGWEQRTRPHRARFVSAHLLVAPGRFVRDVPYDPELYFHGEEITLSVRAFTHGYDLFEPSRVMLWHEYTRADRRKHWDDHRGDRGPAWHDRDAASLARVRRLFEGSDVGRFGLGTERTLKEYEAYAGISFRHRKVQDYTRLNLEPPNPPAEENWFEQVQKRHIDITVDPLQFPAEAVDDALFWYVGVRDHEETEIHRRDFEAAELAEKLVRGQPITLTAEFESQAHPATWTVIPCTKTDGWLDPVTGDIDGNAGSIFVSIASYRDPELVPTVRDCLAKARNPERLRFGICWQHASDEELPDWFSGQQFRVLDVDCHESGGANWARAKVMELWDGEEWYLQLDSHHRFASDWDALLLDEIARTNSDRPILTTYGPPYSPSEPEPSDRRPMSMRFREFTPDGMPMFRPHPIADWEQRKRPHRARFVSAHLLFAPGSFVSDVPCDPDLYFTGDESTLGVRAFTHGYDLFEPSRVIVWHEYTRAYRRKHWNDHLGDGGPAWHDRDAVSRAKMRRLFDRPSFDRFGLGTERTLEDYEAYAGISFRYRKVQDYTRQNLEPPNPPADPNWPLQVADHRIGIALDIDALSREALDAAFWSVTLHDPLGRELHRWQVRHAELVDSERRPVDGRRLMLTAEFESQADPVTWTVTPYSEGGGWLRPLTGTINDKESVCPDARHPARVPGITWESAGDRYIARLPGDARRRRELNSSGALLVELADGRHSVRDIARYLKNAHQLIDDPLSEILDFYEDARSAGLVTIGEPR
jgi:Glycosyltransferase (GlcNAc)